MTSKQFDPSRANDQPHSGVGPGNEAALPQPTNPYAPTMASDLPDRSIAPFGHDHVSTLGLIVNTMIGVTLSGGVFGIGVTAVGRAPSTFVIFGALAGCFLAFVASVAIVPILSAGNLLVQAPGEPWTAIRIHLFGALAGFLCGYFWIPFISGFSPWSVLLGFIPGVIGAVGTNILLIPLGQRARRAWEHIPEIDAGRTEQYVEVWDI